VTARALASAALSVVTLLCLGLASIAHGERATVDDEGPIFIDGHGQTADHITVRVMRSAVLIHDSAGLRLKGTGCTKTSSSRVSCGRSPDVEIGSARGDDRIVVKIDRGANLLAAGIDGGRGEDRIVDAREFALLFGGPGDDRIHGGGGMDDVEGDEGRDWLFGGRGSDAIFARDRTSDRLLDCGPGRRETAKVDRGLDPRPRHC
jgi:Ca2+-binding RTX toxin-like protein